MLTQNLRLKGLIALTGALLPLLSNPTAFAATFSVTTTSIKNGVDGVAYSDQLISANGTGTVTWKLATGSSLVTGLTLSSSGAITGTPTASTNGPGSFKVVATDSATPTKHTANGTINYIINPENGSFRITSTTLKNATVGTAYSTSIQSSGGVGTVTYALINSTTLPPGLTLASTGAVTGTPMTPETVKNFWVQATDSSTPTKKTVTAYLGIVVEPSQISVTTTSLTGATAGTAYSKTLAATGGKSPYTWSLVSGTSFDGLKLSSAGVLSGTPINPETSASFTVKVSDSSTPALADFATIHIMIAAAPLQISSPTSLPNGELNLAYSTQFKAKGGVTPYKWAFVNGTAAALPPGLTLNSTTGTLSGKPTATTAADPAGSAGLEIQVMDSKGSFATVAYSLTVAAPVTASNPEVLPEGVAGHAYSTHLVASQGVAPYKWTVLSAPPPPGLTLSSAGVLSGTPKSISNGPSNFGVRVTDALGGTLTTSISITIVYPLGVGPSTMAPAYVGTNYQATLLAGGGTAPYKYTVTGLPGGLTAAASTNGGETISGMPTTVGANDEIEVTVTDSSNPQLKLTNVKVGLPVLAAVSTCAPKNSSAATLAKLKGGYAIHLEHIYLTLGDANVFTLGAFTADGAGNVNGGVYDSNSPRLSAVVHGIFTGTYAIGTDGRGEMQISLPTASGPPVKRNYCIAIDSLTNGVADGAAVVSDDATDIVTHGRLFAQGGASFTEESVKGSWAFGIQGAKADGAYELPSKLAGYSTLDGAGNVTAGEFDSNGISLDQQTGTVSNNYESQVAVTGAYTMASNGRGTMTLTNSAGGASLIFYVAGPGQFLLMSGNPGTSSKGQADVMAGRALLRTTSSFTNATLKGTSVFVDNGIQINTDSWGPKTGVGLLTWDGGAGTGHVTGSADENNAGVVKTSELTGTYTVDAEGRAVLSDSNGKSSQPVIYLAGPNAGFGLIDDVSATFLLLEDQQPPAGGFTDTSITGAFSEGSLWNSWVDQTSYSGEFVANNTAWTLAATVDENTSGTISVGVARNFEYAAATNGRFAVSPHGSTTPVYAMYFVSPTKAYAVDITDNPWPVLTEVNHQ